MSGPVQPSLTEPSSARDRLALERCRDNLETMNSFSFEARGMHKIAALTYDLEEYLNR